MIFLLSTLLGVRVFFNKKVNGVFWVSGPDV